MNLLSSPIHKVYNISYWLAMVSRLHCMAILLVNIARAHKAWGTEAAAAAAAAFTVAVAAATANAWVVAASQLGKTEANYARGIEAAAATALAKAIAAASPIPTNTCVEATTTTSLSIAEAAAAAPLAIAIAAT